MAIDPLLETSQRSVASTIQTSGASQSRLNFGEDFEDFLRLLVTQLQNQDPLSPLESHEFTNQLVLFAGVEQQIRSNELSEQLVASEKQRKLTNGLNLIGKKVQYGDGYQEFDALGQINFRFNVPENIANAQLQVFDENQRLVTQINTGEMTAGDRSFVWKGEIYSAEGRETGSVDRGKFTFKIASAEDERGINIPPSRFTVLDSEGIAVGVALENDSVLVELADGKQVPLDSVSLVSQGDQEASDSLSSWMDDLSKLSGLIGKEISYRSTTVPYKDGQADFKFSLPGNADSGSVYITDLDGRLIYSDTLSLSPTADGKGIQSNTYTWDGTAYQYDADGALVRNANAQGEQSLVLGKAQEAEYLFYLNNVKAGTTEIPSSRFQYDLPVRSGKVSSVETIEGYNLILRVDNAPVLPESITQVKESSFLEVDNASLLPKSINQAKESLKIEL